MNKEDQLLQIEAALQTLEPTYLEIIDDSGKHRGHGGWRGEGILSHIHVKIASPQFEGKSRVQRHRLVMDNIFHKSGENLHSVKVSIVGCP